MKKMRHSTGGLVHTQLTKKKRIKDRTEEGECGKGKKKRRILISSEERRETQRVIGDSALMTTWARTACIICTMTE